MKRFALLKVLLATAFFACSLILPSAAAELLPEPLGDTVLTVTGKIAATNAGNAARFDQAMLENLPQTTVVSVTDWTEGEQEFSGVLLRVLLERLGATGETLIARALNDYQATIPIEDLDRYDVLLALKRNGRFMPVRDKGPIWIVYPNDQTSDGVPFPHNDKMVWQLAAIDVQ